MDFLLYEISVAACFYIGPILLKYLDSIVYTPTQLRNVILCDKAITPRRLDC